MKQMREKFSPRPAIRLEDLQLDTPLDVLQLLIRAYVPQGTSDAAEAEKALRALADGVAGRDPQTFPPSDADASRP
jgi:hypothetical protein